MKFCDIMCIYAKPIDTGVLDRSGIGRPLQAIYCTKKNEIVQKNMPCGEKKVRKD